MDSSEDSSMSSEGVELTVKQIEQKILYKYNDNKKQLDLCTSQYVDSDDQPQAWPLIIQHQDWTFVRVLWLDGNKITDESIKILLTVKWPNLKQLSLGTIILLIIEYNKLTDQGVKSIVEHEWSQLTAIDLGIDFIQVRSK